MSPLTLPAAPRVSPLTVGAVHTAELRGIAGPWTITGTATVWEVTETPDGETAVLLQLSDRPSPHRLGHTTYARGRVSPLTDGSLTIVQILTPQPGPTEIGLGYRVLTTRHLGDAEHHQALADKALADWTPLDDGDGPLGSEGLPHLARAAAAARTGQADIRLRTQLVRRLRAGGVDRREIAAVADLDPSRISQLAPSSRED